MEFSPIAYAMPRNPGNSEFWRVVSDNTFIESRPPTPVAESRPEVINVQPRSSGSSSQVNTHRWIGSEINRLLFNDQMHDPRITQDSLRSINSNVSNTFRRGITINDILNPINDNFNIGINQSTIMQSISQSSFQAQSNIHEIGVIAQSGFTQPNLKPTWIGDYSNLVNVTVSSNSNVMFTSSLPWREIELSELSKINRPKILGINYDFAHQNIEAIIQQYSNPREFLVSHEHIPNLTRSNYKQCIIDYYYNSANNRVYIYPNTLLIENGDARIVLRNV